LDVVCHQLVLKEYSKNLKVQRPTLSQQSSSKVIAVDQGSIFNQPSKVYDIFNLQAKDFLTYPDLPQGVETEFALKLKDIIFCFNSSNYSSLNECWLMDLKDAELKWSKFASLNNVRYTGTASAKVHRDGLVVCGGQTPNSDCSNSAEFYQVALNEWKTISGMNGDRKCSALVSCRDWLYCVGGIAADGSVLSSVERIHNMKGEWEFVEPMLVQRTNFAAVNCDGFIYAIAGKDVDEFDILPLNSVERYDPAENKWCFVKELNVNRYEPAACVLNGKIYVFGGSGEIEESTFIFVVVYNALLINDNGYMFFFFFFFYKHMKIRVQVRLCLAVYDFEPQIMLSVYKA